MFASQTALKTISKDTTEEENNNTKKSVENQSIPPIGLKAQFIKQMVKEDFYPHKYDRSFKGDTGGRDGQRGGACMEKKAGRKR